MSEQPTLHFSIRGMHCAACSARIERVGGKIPGVKKITVSLAANTAALEIEPGAEPRDIAQKFEDTVEKLGFSASPYGGGGDSGESSDMAALWQKRTAEQLEDIKARKAELKPAFLFTIPLFILSMGEMAGMPLPFFMSPDQYPFIFAFIQLLLCAPVMWLGRRFFTQGIPALLRGGPNMDTLVALGTAAAFLYSVWNTLVLAFPDLLPGLAAAHNATQTVAQATMPHANGFWDMFFGSGHSIHGVELYYESAAMVIALVSLGKYLEAKSRMRTSEAVKELLDLTPPTAIRLTPDAEGGPAATGERAEIPLSEVQVGDLLLIQPGAKIPVDGAVIEGSSSVDESMLTGESIPVEKAKDAPLAGGTLNKQGVMVMRADRVGKDTMLARIVRLVQDAQGSKAPIAGLADRVSLYFVPAVMAIALVSGLLWAVFGESTSFAVRVFVSVMVIACPCAMGLATPMSIMVGTGRGAQLGVLFKNGQALENTARLSFMVFDKTGTLTEGRPALTDLEPLRPEHGPEHGREGLLKLAASLEAASEHPLAQAIMDGAEKEALTLLPVEGFKAISGQGVIGSIITPEGPIDVGLGNLAFVKEHCPALDPESLATLTARVRYFAAQGKTPVVLVINKAPAAIITVADTLREEAPEVLAALKKMGVRALMLTGDNHATAAAVAAKIGIENIMAEVMPEEKEKAVLAVQNTGQVVGMVGDGVNDAPALARADVGFAMSSGIDVAVETGDVVLMRHGLSAVPTALALGRATLRNIKGNLFWAFAYNIIGIPFAAGLFHIFGGPVLSPMLAGAAMALSSVSVVTNALRLRFFR